MCSMASSQLIFVHVCILLFQFVWSHVQYEPQEMLNDGFVAGDGGCILNNYNTCSCLRIGHTNVFRLGDPDSGVFFCGAGWYADGTMAQISFCAGSRVVESQSWLLQRLPLLLFILCRCCRRRC